MKKFSYIKFALNCLLVFFGGWVILSSLPAPTVNWESNTNKSIYKLSGGGTGQSYSNDYSSQLTRRSQKSDSNEFQKMLETYFPDWDARLGIEKRQAIIYRKATKKLEAYKIVYPTLNNPENILTREEQLAIDYFHGRGVCGKYQDPTISINIYDTRKTFLRKMENPKMRQEFLDYYNQQLTPISEN